MKAFSLNLVRVKHRWRTIGRTGWAQSGQLNQFRGPFSLSETIGDFLARPFTRQKHICTLYISTCSDREARSWAYVRNDVFVRTFIRNVYVRNYMNQLKPPPCWSVGSIPRSFVTLHAVHRANKDCLVIEVKNRNYYIYIYIAEGQIVSDSSYRTRIVYNFRRVWQYLSSH